MLKINKTEVDRLEQWLEEEECGLRYPAEISVYRDLGIKRIRICLLLKDRKTAKDDLDLGLFYIPFKEEE